MYINLRMKVLELKCEYHIENEQHINLKIVLEILFS